MKKDVAGARLLDARWPVYNVEACPRWAQKEPGVLAAEAS
jgi:hypothetical protein